MAIALDGSTPAFVDNDGSTSATATTAAFSPPANSLIVIVVNIGFAVTTGTGPGVTVADSLSNAYTAGPSEYDTVFDGCYIFSRFYSSAPGSITVTATRTTSLGSALFQLVPYVLTGAASNQAGAGSAHTSHSTTSTTCSASITTTVSGSWTIVGASVGHQPETFTVVGVSTDHSHNDVTDGNSGAGGHAVTGTPGATTLGWTLSVASDSAWAALEILPSSSNVLAQLATATGQGLSPASGTGINVNAQLAQALGSAGLPACSATSTVFPAKNLQMRVDLNLNGAWTDITRYVYQRNPVNITNVGRTDWTSTISASQMTLTLNNRDGRFTPKLTSGAYYPNITRNTQIRVFITATSGPASRAPINLNTGFESGVANWSTSNGATLAASSAQAHTGTSSLTFHGDGATASPLVNSEQEPVGPGTQYTASVWWFNTATWASGVLTQINWYDVNHNFISNSFTLLPSLPGGAWTQVTVTGTAPSTAAYANLNAIISGTPASGNNFFIDDATLSQTWPSGISYSGFRFYGEVSEWPVKWDPSQRDVAVDIIASGIWRRLSQLDTPLGSPYRRFKTNTAGTIVLRSYWPCEDGSGSQALVPYGSVTGTGNATQQFVAGQAGLSMASGGGFPGSDDVCTLNGALVTALVPSGGTATNNVTRFVINVPAGGDSGAAGGNWNLVEINSVGTVARFEVYLTGTTKLIMQLRNSGGALLAQGTTTTNVAGTPYLVSCELTPSGGNVNFAMRLIKPGASGITESMTGTVTGASVGQIRSVRVSRGYTISDTAFGHLSVAYGAPTSMVQEAYVLNGYTGEFALDRFKRICGEIGITASTIGTSSSSAPMGPQLDSKLSDVLQSIEDTDCGLLYELRDSFGIGYRTNASLFNQNPQFTLNYTSATVDTNLSPSYDDALTRNNVTVSNWTGYTQQAILNSGSMSINNPPNGIGNGYNYQRSVNAAKDNQLPGITGFLLNVGTVDEIRIPNVTVKMVRSTSAGLFSEIPNADIGDYFQITNPPSFLTTSTVKQLMWGYSETLNAREWTFTFNTIPEAAFESGFNPGTVVSAQIPGGSPVSFQAQNSLGLAGLLANGSITPGMLSSGVSTVFTQKFGSNTAYVTDTAPYKWTFTVTDIPAAQNYFICTQSQATPIMVGDTFSNMGSFGGPFTVTQVDKHNESGNVSVTFTPTAAAAMSSGTVQGGTNGDQWVDTSSDNQVNMWQSGAWTPMPFGTNAIQAGSITAQHLAAGSVTAGAIAAGAIDGQVVNALTINGVQINGGQFTASGPNDGYFAYGSASSVVQNFSSGSGSWVCPSGVTSLTVEVLGGGGGGANGYNNRGGGGAGGGYALNIWSVTPGNTYFYSVGGGGAGGFAGGSTAGDGAAGGDSWFNSVNSNGGTVATGGGGGKAGSTPQATGGTASGTFSGSNNGGKGGRDTVGGGGGGGGGGGAGSGSNGSDGGTTATGFAAYGGSGGASSGTPGAISGGNGGLGGKGGANYTNGQNGVGGVAPGGGGGAGGGGVVTNGGGGAGAKGKVRLSYSSGAPTLSASIAGAIGTEPVNAQAVPQGFMGPIVGIQPLSSPVAAESYHTVPTLQNSWTQRNLTQNTYPLSSYCVTADNDLRMALYLEHAAQATVGQQLLFTLPSGYIPSHTHIVPVQIDNMGAPGAGSTPCIIIRGSGEASPGQVQVANIPGGTGTCRIQAGNISVPMGL